MADRINQQLGIEEAPYRLVLGKIDLLLDAKGHMQSLAIRTNPSTWRRGSLTPLPNRLRPVWPQFRVTYDANHIASYHVPIRIDRDLFGRSVSLVPGESISSSTAELADNVVVGVTEESYLSEFRFVNLDLSFD